MDEEEEIEVGFKEARSTVKRARWLFDVDFR
jgi:hypothetical protein